jgi:group II intron reverse transcriptase/maturase
MMQTKSIPISKQMVWEAYKKVKANKGSAGIDGISLEMFDEKLSGNLYKIWNRLTSGSYFPPPVKEVEIPKKDGNTRKLGIPTISDRIAQMVIKNHIEVRIDKQFHKNSYGYRPLRSAHDALEQVRKNCRNYDWVIDLDIKGFFDNIDHALLIIIIDKHVEEMWIKMYLMRWLKMPVLKVDGELRQNNGKGTPQGGVISPLLANLFLHYVFDKWLEINHPTVSFVRYADDAIVNCSSKEEAETILVALNARMIKCKLQLHPDKTKIVYCKDYRRREKYKNVKFDFLGYSFQPRPTKSKRDSKLFLGFDLAISSESRKRIIKEITRTCFHRWSTATPEEIAKLLNPKIRGWINYYGRYRRNELSKVFRKLDYRLTKWIRNRYKRIGTRIRDAYKYLKKIRLSNPILFAHWAVGFKVQ